MTYSSSKSFSFLVLALLMSSSICLESKASRYTHDHEETDDDFQRRGIKRDHGDLVANVNILVERVYDNHTNMLSIRKILEELERDNSEQSALLPQYVEELKELDQEEEELRRIWADLKIDSALWDLLVSGEDRSMAIACFNSLYQNGNSDDISSSKKKKPRKFRLHDRESEVLDNNQESEDETPLKTTSSSASSFSLRSSTKTKERKILKAEEKLERARQRAVAKLRQGGVILSVEDEQNIELVESLLSSLIDERKKQPARKNESTSSSSSTVVPVDQDSALEEVLERSRLEAVTKLHHYGVELSDSDAHNLDVIDAQLGFVMKENQRIREEQNFEYQKSLHADQLKQLEKKHKTLVSELEQLKAQRLEELKPLNVMEEKVSSLRSVKENHEMRMLRFGENQKLQKSIEEIELEIEKIKAEKKEFLKLKEALLTSMDVQIEALDLEVQKTLECVARAKAIVMQDESNLENQSELIQ